jgi:uncharacterized membrane protein
MNMRPVLIANTVLVSAMAAVSAWAWVRLPPDAQVPVHWNLEGEIDRFGSKAEALLFMPAVAVGVTLLLWLLPRLDPRRANVEASAKFWNAVTIGVVALLAYIHVLLVLSAVGGAVGPIEYVMPGVATLMIVIGNYLSKTRSNWFGGVRTPWTLSSDYAWEKTHRWAGRLFVATGVATIAVWFAAGTLPAMIVLVAALIASSVASIVLSYVFWKNDPTRASNGA